jgi:DNA-binding CsgD family transcriptional regulator
MHEALRRIDELTDRELELFAVLGGGSTNAEIAETLNISERTVKFHVTNLRKKLGGINRVQLCMVSFVHSVRQDVWDRGGTFELCALPPLPNRLRCAGLEA